MVTGKKKTSGTGAAAAAAAAAAGPQQEGEDLRGMGGYWMTVRVTLGVLSYIVQALNRIPGGL